MGPAGSTGHHSDFHAPEGQHRTKGMTHVTGVQGAGGVENEAVLPPKFDRARPLVPLWLLSGHPERSSPVRAKPCSMERPRQLLQKTKEQMGKGAARRVVAQASFSCPCGAIHLLAPYGSEKLQSGGRPRCAAPTREEERGPCPVAKFSRQKEKLTSEVTP